MKWNGKSPSVSGGLVEYATYRSKNGPYGFVGTTRNQKFKDNNIIPDTSLTPPGYRLPFEGIYDKPGAVGYFQQRRVFRGYN